MVSNFRKENLNQHFVKPTDIPTLVLILLQHKPRKREEFWMKSKWLV